MTQSFMAVHWHWPALISAWLLSVYGLYLLVQVVRRIRASDKEAGSGWWVGGGLCIGTGIWAETFLGLIAMQLPIKIGYSPSIVLASWLPSVLIACAVIWMLSKRQLALGQRVAGNVAFALGFALLIVVDVASMLIQPAVHWNLMSVLAGSALMLVGCLIGSVLVRRDLDQTPNHLRTLSHALLVGTLIRIAQWILIGGVEVPAGASSLAVHQMTGDALEWLFVATVLLVFVLVHMGTALDIRTRTKQEQLVQSLKQAQIDLEALAFRDGSTGLLNRVGFEEKLVNLIDNKQQPVAVASVLRISLDGFRAFVDTYGHALGENLMRSVADQLRGVIREKDAFARSDSDEFLLLCVGLGETHVATQLAQRLEDAVRQPRVVDEVDLIVTCSIGISRYPDSTTSALLLSHSMDALETARRSGGAVHCFYESGMDRRDAEQVEMQRDLRHAIARNELALHFQPKIRITGEVAGVEALLRWTHPQRGGVSPALFIPVAERFGLIGELGAWVMEEACRHIRIWMDKGKEIPVAVNLSAFQLRQHDLALRVRDVLERHQVPPHLMILEITETAAMDDIEASIRVFDQLADIGVQLSIDDFGTGYSSLSYLRRLPARQLKIDRAFVRDLETSPDSQAIVEAVVRLSHALGMKVVAEGVETQDQANLLALYTCDELQGFLFAKPMPETALWTWLANHKDEPIGHNLFGQFADVAAV